MPREWCFILGRTSREGGTGDRTDRFAKPFLLLIKLSTVRPSNCRFLFPEESGSVRIAMTTSRRLYFKKVGDQQYVENL